MIKIIFIFVLSNMLCFESAHSTNNNSIENDESTKKTINNVTYSPMNSLNIDMNSSNADDVLLDANEVNGDLTAANNSVAPKSSVIGLTIITALSASAVIYGITFYDNRTHQLHTLRHRYCLTYPGTDKNCMNIPCLQQHNISISAYENCFENQNTCWNIHNDSIIMSFKQCLDNTCLENQAMCEEVSIHHNRHATQNNLGEITTVDDQILPYFDKHQDNVPFFATLLGSMGLFRSLLGWINIVKGNYL